jgi:hypothetical protein
VTHAGHLGAIALARHGREDADVFAHVAAAHVVVFGGGAVDGFEAVGGEFHLRVGGWVGGLGVGAEISMRIGKR